MPFARPWRALLILAIPGSAGLAGCAEPPEEVLIGFPMSSVYAPIVAVAQDELDERRRPREARIRIVWDSVRNGERSDTELERAEQFSADPRIVAIAGHAGSRGSLVAGPIYNERKIPQVVPTGTSRLLQAVGQWTFVLPPDDSTEGAFIARYVVDVLKARQATIFYDNDEYGTGLRDGVRAELSSRGAMVLDVVPIIAGADLETLVLAALKRASPDVVVVAGRQHDTGTTARLVFQMLPGVPVVGGDGSLVLPALRDIAGPAAQILSVVSFWVPTPGDSLSEAFVARWRRVAGVAPTGPQAMFHDAIMLLAQAIREVGPDRAAICRYLETLGVRRPPYRGVTGPVSFGPERVWSLRMVRLTEDGLQPVPLHQPDTTGGGP